MKRAALLGHYGAGNLGDELMLICLKAWLASQSIEVMPIASDAQQVFELHGIRATQNYPMLGQFSWVESLARGKVLTTLKAIYQSDFVVCGGGDVIRDSLGYRPFSYQVEKLVVAWLCRKPLFLLNVGISRPVTWYGRRFLKWLLPKCRAIVVREQRSVEVCRELGAGARVSLLPDIVLCLPDFFPLAKPRAEVGKFVLVALHGDSNVYGRYLITDARIQALADALDSVVEQHDLDIHFFPFQRLETGGDLLIHQTVQSRMRHSERTTVLNWTVDCAEIAARFSRSRMVIAMRLHAAVLAALYRRPCVLMPYDEKVVAFGRDAGIRFTLGPKALDEPAIAKTVLNEALSGSSANTLLEHSTEWLSFALPQS